MERIDDGYGAVHMRAVPEEAVHAYALFTQLKNKDMCVRGRARGTTVAKDCLRMIALVAGGEELCESPC